MTRPRAKLIALVIVLAAGAVAVPMGPKVLDWYAWETYETYEFHSMKVTKQKRRWKNEHRRKISRWRNGQIASFAEPWLGSEWDLMQGVPMQQWDADGRLVGFVVESGGLVRVVHAKFSIWGKVEMQVLYGTLEEPAQVRMRYPWFTEEEIRASVEE